MACGRNEIVQHVLPVLDALAGRIVTSLALYDQLASAPRLAAAAQSASERGASALAQAAGAVSRTRSLSSGAGASAEQILAQARAAVGRITARVSSQLSNPSGAALLNEALSGLTAESIKRLAAFTRGVRGVPRALDTRAGRGRIALAAQAVLDFVAGDEATVMAYAQLLADQIRLAGRRQLDHLSRMEQDLLGLHELALRLYDGPWVETDRLERAMAKVEAGRDEAARVRLRLSEHSLFHATGFERCLERVHEARELLSPSGVVQLVSPTGRARDLDSIAHDALRIGALKARLQETLPLAGVEHASLQDLMGALVGLEREWPQATRKAARQLSALEVFEQSLDSIAGSIDAALTGGSDLGLAQGQAEWLLELTLATGQVELAFHPATRAVLARQSEFAITTAAYQQTHAALLDLGPRSFDDTEKVVRAALEAAPAVASGATGGLLSGRHGLEEWTTALTLALRALRTHREYVGQVLQAVAGLTGFQDGRLDHLQALLAAYRMEGWRALLSGGRLAQLLDLDPQTVTRAGVALACVHSLLPTAPPKQRQHLQVLVDDLENHRRVEELILSREDDLQVLYDQTLDRETGRLTGLHERVTGLVGAMLEESRQDPGSPGNTYARALASIDADCSLDPKAAVEARRQAAEAFFVETRGVAPG